MNGPSNAKGKDPGADGVSMRPLILTALVAALVLLAVAGCGSADDPSPPTSADRAPRSLASCDFERGGPKPANRLAVSLDVTCDDVETVFPPSIVRSGAGSSTSSYPLQGWQCSVSRDRADDPASFECTSGNKRIAFVY